MKKKAPPSKSKLNLALLWCSVLSYVGIVVTLLGMSIGQWKNGMSIDSIYGKIWFFISIFLLIPIVLQSLYSIKNKSNLLLISTSLSLLLSIVLMYTSSWALWWEDLSKSNYFYSITFFYTYFYSIYAFIPNFITISALAIPSIMALISLHHPNKYN